MALDIINPLNESFLDVFPPEILSRIGGLITILKAAGIVLIGYIVFLVLRWVFSFKRYKKIKKMHKKIDEIDRKLDILLSEKRVKHKEKHKKGKKKK